MGSCATRRANGADTAIDLGIGSLGDVFFQGVSAPNGQPAFPRGDKAARADALRPCVCCGERRWRICVGVVEDSGRALSHVVTRDLSVRRPMP